MDYLGNKCPVCGQEFMASDDIVVCPDCGTPHHRDCYTATGHCYNKILHSDSFEWKDERAVRMPMDQSDRPEWENGNSQRTENRMFGGGFYGRYIPNEGTGTHCPFCKSEISESAQFCNFCGRPIVRGEIDGISVRNWSYYLGNQAPSILAVFKNQDLKKKKTAFYIPLLLIPEVFFLYRRMWLETAIYEILGGLLSLPSMLLLLYGETTIWGVPSTTWVTLESIGTVFLIAIRIFCALYGLWLYRRKGERKIKRIIASSADEAEVTARLTKTGPTMIPLWILLGIYVVYFIWISVM